MTYRAPLHNRIAGTIEDAAFCAKAWIQTKWKEAVLQLLGALVLGSAIAILIAIISAIAYSGHVLGACIIGSLMVALVVCIIKLSDAVTCAVSSTRTRR